MRIDEVIDQKIEALWTLESQIESFWATGNFEGVVPMPKQGDAREARKREFNQRFKARSMLVADDYRAKLIELYGEEVGNKTRHAEAFELCEYGRRASPADLKKLFPFFE